MKQTQTASSVIAKIMQERHFAPLKRNLYCKDFLCLLSQSHQLLISKIFIKNEILFILTKSNIGYQELNHDNTKKSIKNLIKIYANLHPLSDFSHIKTLKIFTDKNFKPRIEKSQKKNSFLELSKGEFRNSCKDKELFERFESLRKAILNA